MKQMFATTTTAQLRCLRKINASLLVLLPLRGIGCDAIVGKQTECSVSAPIAIATIVLIDATIGNARNPFML